GFVEQVGFDRPLELHGHRVAAAVQRLAGDHPDPALADAVLLDVGALLAVEADADAAFQQGGVVVRAARVEGQAVGKWRAHAPRISDHGPGIGPRLEWDTDEPGPSPARGRRTGATRRGRERRAGRGSRPRRPAEPGRA